MDEIKSKRSWILSWICLEREDQIAKKLVLEHFYHEAKKQKENLKIQSIRSSKTRCTSNTVQLQVWRSQKKLQYQESFVQCSTLTERISPCEEKLIGWENGPPSISPRDHQLQVIFSADHSEQWQICPSKKEKKTKKRKQKNKNRGLLYYSSFYRLIAKKSWIKD